MSTVDRQAPGVRQASGVPILIGLVTVAGAAALGTLQITAARPAAAPLVVAGCAVAIVLIRWPRWVLPAFAALTWTAIDASLLGGLPSPIQYGGIALAGAGAVRAARVPSIAAEPLRVVGLLAAAVVISWLAAGDRTGLVIVDPLRDLLFLLIGAWCVRGRADVDRTLTALAAVGVLLGGGAVWSVLVAPSTLFPVVSEGVGHLRAAGPFGEPNFFALSLATLTAPAIVLLRRGGGRSLLGAASLLAIVAGILATGSRGALLATGFAVIAIAVTGDRRSRVIAVLAVVAVLGMIPFFGGQLGGAEGRTVAGRASENLIALTMASDHPLLGVGPGGYPARYRDYARRIGNDPRSSRQPHSLPLQIAAEQGAVGLLCWLGAGLLVAAALWRARRYAETRTVAIAIGTYLVGSLFLHGSQLRLLYLLAGLALALGWAATHEPDDEPDEPDDERPYDGRSDAAQRPLAGVPS
jgi:O-antigen ligase